MIGGGLGTDAVVCSGGLAKRYWLRSYSGPRGDSSDDIEAAACDQSNGYTTLSFTRSIAAANNMQREMTPGTAQPVVVAWGVGEDVPSPHGDKQGMQLVDFGSDASLVSGTNSHGVIFAPLLAIMFI